MAALDPIKGHAALRRGRFSTAGANYFLTLCTANKRSGLTSDTVARAIHHEFTAMDADATWTDRCHVVMPDHLHALIVLGDRLPLPRAIQRLKAKTSAVLHSAGLAWERGFFDHKLRADEPADPIFRYIYLNPYRANLLPIAERWPHYHCAAKDWEWFSQQLDRRTPDPRVARPLSPDRLQAGSFLGDDACCVGACLQAIQTVRPTHPHCLTTTRYIYPIAVVYLITMKAPALSAITPGEILLEDWMRPNDISRNALSRRTGIPASRLTEIIKGRRSITADTALRLGRFFATGERFWLNLQLARDIELARAALGPVLERQIKPLVA